MKQPTDSELEETATIFRNNGQVQQAVAAYTKLVERFEKAKDAKRAAEMQHMIGVSYKVGNHTEESLRALDDALARYQAISDTVGVGRALRDKGITYQYTKRFSEAKEFLEKSVTTLQGSGDAAELGISEAKVGHLLHEVGVLDKAEQWIERGLETLRGTSHWFYISTALLHKASLQLALHHYALALQVAEEAEAILRSHNGEQVQKRRLAQLWYMKADIYRAMGEFEKATESREAGDRYAALLDSASQQYIKERHA